MLPGIDDVVEECRNEHHDKAKAVDNVVDGEDGRVSLRRRRWGWQGAENANRGPASYQNADNDET